MINTDNRAKKIFLGYLILTFYYLGALAMIFTITYPPFQEVKENFTQHAMVFEQYLVWALYIPGVLMAFSSIALIFFRPACLSKGAVTVSAVLSLISVATMYMFMIPFHHDWITTGFDSKLFEELQSIIIPFQLVPSILQALMAVCFMYIYLNNVQRTTRVLFILLFVLSFFPMGTVIIECHVNYALWATVGSADWLAYRQWLVMPVFLAVFLIPVYFPIVLLIVLSVKRREGLSRKLVLIALACIVYVLVISAAYFVPDLQFELDKYHSQELIQELIISERWLRAPVELVFWIVVAMMFWKFKPESVASNR